MSVTTKETKKPKRVTCPCCENEVDVEDMESFTYRDSERDKVETTVCNTCAQENYHECTCCSEMCEATQMSATYDGEYVCDSCSDEDFCTCYECAKKVHSEDVERVTGANGRTVNVCPKCAEGDNYFICGECEERKHQDLNNLDRHNRNICDACATDYFSTCPSCDELIETDDFNIDESTGGCSCPECSTNLAANELIRGNAIVPPTPVTPASEESRIKEYSYKPTPQFKTYVPPVTEITTTESIPIISPDIYEELNPYLGIELEIESSRGKCDAKESDKSPQELAIVAHEFLKGFAYYKKDGSLSNGVEIVTHPATLKYHQNSVDYKACFEKLDECGAKSHDTSTCGLHVHISKEKMPTKYQEKFGYFFSEHKVQLEKIARRGEVHFAKFKKKSDTGPFNYSPERYAAVNWQPGKTVELRLFKGTLNYDAFISTLELSHASYVYCATPRRKEKDIESWVEFCLFVESKKELYSHLPTYMKHHGVWYTDKAAESVAKEAQRKREEEEKRIKIEVQRKKAEDILQSRERDLQTMIKKYVERYSHVLKIYKDIDRMVNFGSSSMYNAFVANELETFDAITPMTISKDSWGVTFSRGERKIDFSSPNSFASKHTDYLQSLIDYGRFFGTDSTPQSSYLNFFSPSLRGPWATVDTLLEESRRGFPCFDSEWGEKCNEATFSWARAMLRDRHCYENSDGGYMVLPMRNRGESRNRIKFNLQPVTTRLPEQTFSATIISSSELENSKSFVTTGAYDLEYYAKKISRDKKFVGLEVPTIDRTRHTLKNVFRDLFDIYCKKTSAQTGKTFDEIFKTHYSELRVAYLLMAYQMGLLSTSMLFSCDVTENGIIRNQDLIYRAQTWAPLENSEEWIGLRRMTYQFAPVLPENPLAYRSIYEMPNSEPGLR